MFNSYSPQSAAVMFKIGSYYLSGSPVVGLELHKLKIPVLRLKLYHSVSTGVN